MALDIDYLSNIISRGGVVKTGVDVFNKEGGLLIAKNAPV